MVQQPEIVDVDRVFSAACYWDVDESSESAWLRERVLPKVRTFLQEHGEHSVLYVDEVWIYEREEKGEKWLEVATGYKNDEASYSDGDDAPVQQPGGP